MRYPMPKNRELPRVPQVCPVVFGRYSSPMRTSATGQRWAACNGLRLLLLIMILSPTLPAAATMEVNGQLRAQAVTSLREADDVLTLENDQDELFTDGGIDGRVNLQYTISPYVFFSSSYEIVASGGQTRKAANSLPGISSPLFTGTPFFPDDSTQLFSLTGILGEEDEYLAYHRLDRLYLELRSASGDLSLGRQALTWGNGMVFNPVDLVNPFAPADIIRDYKIGSDMVHYRYSGDSITDLQMAYVPRRDQESGDVSVDASTLAGKLSFSRESRDVDLYTMRHYSDTVLGVGLNAFLGEALFRSDVIVTIPDDTAAYISAVANIDYSWTWVNKNWYGMLELYYNVLDKDSPLEAFADPAVSERLLRGDLFATGRTYLTGLLRYEAHPLVNINTSIIMNLQDGSFLLQPRVDWSISQALHLLAGINIAAGGTNTEYGTIEIPDTEVTTGRPQQLYLVLTWYL